MSQLRESRRPSNRKRIGIFRIFEVSESEILLGKDDKHLNFRVSVLRQVRDAGGQGTRQEINNQVLIEFVAKQARAGDAVLSVCTAGPLSFMPLACYREGDNTLGLA